MVEATEATNMQLISAASVANVTNIVIPFFFNLFLRFCSSSDVLSENCCFSVNGRNYGSEQ